MKKRAATGEPPASYYKNLRILANPDLHDIVVAKIQSILPPASSILDYGAGEGALSQRLTDMGYKVTAVDLDREHYNAEATFIQVDFDDPVSSSGFIHQYKDSFDLVMGIEVIEHVQDPWQFIRDLKQLVKPGGTLIISTPNVSSWYSRITFLIKGRLQHFEDSDYQYGHINPVFESEIRLICAKNGLLVQEILHAGSFNSLWSRKSLKRYFAIALGILGYPFMGGHRDGWYVIGVIMKP